MEKKKPSAKFLKQRRFLLVLPLFVIPVLCVLFGLAGGGSAVSITVQNAGHPGNVNPKLPDAHFKKGKDKNKMNSYEEADMDSAKYREAKKKDPNYINEHSSDSSAENKTSALESILQHAAASSNQQGLIANKNLNPSSSHSSIDPNEQKITLKLEQLKAALNKKQEAKTEKYSPYSTGSNNPDLERLQMMMNNMQQRNSNASDPEMTQINNVLEKMMVVQHPEMLQDSMKMIAEKNKPVSYAVSLNDTSQQQGFYGLSDDNENNNSNAIEAVVDETQTLVSGAVIKLRLLQNIYVHGSLISKDQLIYGIASLNNERLKISITSIRSNDNILPVSLDVYDMDGLAGIYIPGSINRDVSKASADEAVSAIGLTSLDPSLGAQAASAGIQAAKTLISRKVKLVRVSVKAGYKVLLKDLNQNKK
jgi:conjugative transposon TraM protein